MTRADARIITAGLLHEGLDVKALSPAARAELRRAIDAVLDLVPVRPAHVCGEGER